MRKISIVLGTLFISLGLFVSCSEDKPSSESIFPTKAIKRNNFEEWVLKNYTYPYNVEVQYKLEHKETDFTYTLTPADSAKSAQLAILIKYLWFDAYNEVAGQNLVKQSAPRLLQMVGSSAYTRQRTEVVGTAEGGYKVSLYKVNELTPELLKDYKLMRTYYFHTMHHEFTHILNQRKPYDPEYDRITESGYVSGNWYSKSAREAHRSGFVSPYAMDQGREDFAEMLAYYVTLSDAEWNAILKDAGDKGATLINQKLAYVKSYMQTAWNVDIDELRTVVLRRSGQIQKIDLTQLR